MNGIHKSYTFVTIVNLIEDSKKKSYCPVFIDAIKGMYRMEHNIFFLKAYQYVINARQATDVPSLDHVSWNSNEIVILKELIHFCSSATTIRSAYLRESHIPLLELYSCDTKNIATLDKQL